MTVIIISDNTSIISLNSQYYILYQLLDVECLQALLGQLTPSKEQLNKTDTRNDWLHQTERLTPVIERLLGSLEDENQGLRSEACKAEVQRCRSVLCSNSYDPTFAFNLF